MMLTKSAILITDHITVWANQPLKSAWIAACGDRQTQLGTIEWDPTKTKLIRATLVIPTLTSERCTEILVSVNNVQVKKYTFDVGDTLEDALDVTSLIHSGTNYFTVQLCDTWCSTRLRPANASITAYLEYEYAGENPDVDGDTWEQFKEWMKKYWWIAIPVVALAIVTPPRRRY